VRHEGYWVKTPDPFSNGFLYDRGIDDLGAPSNKPVLLNENGTQKIKPKDAFSVEAHHLLFPVFADVSFGSMGF
jgi:hypothetical protein